jgi:ABC-type oligopeptide transport system substrate-binding subunit
MKTKFKKIFLLLTLLLTFGITQIFAQKSKSKTKTHKSHKMKSSSSNNADYYNGHKIYTGPRGGRYYINSNGNKTYI